MRIILTKYPTLYSEGYVNMCMTTVGDTMIACVNTFMRLTIVGTVALCSVELSEEDIASYVRMAIHPIGESWHRLQVIRQ